MKLMKYISSCCTALALTLCCALNAFALEVLSAAVIKCKKTPRKKCSFVAEVKGKR